ncbi:hypothetical protein EPUS_05921 [Endocarpon pusillum Z07020]|uniref:C2H2-type domain-containing protein n=1 Tax=Endocarpon pusillum (strain Z07020 / HMAS-L-300199) TaxID=1263415 RepID=U1HWW4_ENDPU|nr:uncharacterized protein EPUS_05921 [Endocarpon pusillum Z07020]ERF73909.1 hypothetical protein EPUS_05921 [Endocarpon pusillum Z07020]
MDMEEAAPFPRASFYLASRLASVVQKFRHRLQKKVQQKKKSPNPFGVSYYRGIRLRALSDLEKSASPCRLTVTKEPRSAVKHQDHGRWINELLRDLNDHSNFPAFSLTRVASDDKLLLSNAQDNLIETLAQHATVQQAAYMFDSSTFLIGKLEAVQLSKVKSWADTDPDCKRLKEESYIANLLHLLRRLQYVLFQILVHRSITRLDEFASHWQTYWQQQKKLGDDWFTEWPSGQRPLSTTWPWNIRPSLVILWGVCWMFYTPEQSNEDKPRSPAAQQLVDGSRNWTLPSNFSADDEEVEQVRRVSLPNDTHSIVPTTNNARPHSQARNHPLQVQAAMGRNLNLPSSRRLSAGAQPQSPNHPYQRPQFELYQGISHGTVDEPQQGVSSTSLHPPFYNQPLPLYSNPTESRDSVSRWTASISGDISTTYANIEQVSSNVWTGYNQQIPPPIHPPRTPVPRFEVSPVQGQNFVPVFDPVGTQGLYRPFPQPAFGQNQDMGGTDDYPSPHSEGGRQPSITTPASMPGSVNADHITTPSSDGGKGLNISIKRGDPPRNAHNQIYCAHPECAKEALIFRRPCEWNKHMDKHDRPYKCLEPGCDKVQGFTYSGGLLRHQREVHKKNNSVGRDLYCPVPNCNRSSHQPFTRQENLKEHMRRRHLPEGEITSPGLQSVVTASATPSRPPPDRPRKRKRITSTDYNHELQFLEEPSDDEEQSEQIKRLRRDNERKDNTISELSSTNYKQANKIRELEGMLATIKGRM